MTGTPRWSRLAAAVVTVSTVAQVTGCGFHGANSFTLPGTRGRGPGSYTIQVQMPDIQTLERNSRVRVNDVTVGTVTNIELQGWHALVTMSLDGDVDLPGDVTATIGQSSLLGSVHVELAPAPYSGAPPRDRLKAGSLVPLSSAAGYPSTERTLAALSLLLNGGGLGQIQDITEALSLGFTGREQDLRSLLVQLDRFVGHLNDQRDDIIAATESLNKLAGEFAGQKTVMDQALKTIPDALAVLADERDNLAGALDEVGKLGALAVDSLNKTRENLVKELKDIGPVLQSLADAGPALTRSLGLYGTFPFPKDTLSNWMRGDSGNLTAVVDLTLSRLDASFFTGTRWEGNLTELEMLWGRTIGQMPSPYTMTNPLVAPYRLDQGP